MKLSIMIVFFTVLLKRSSVLADCNFSGGPQSCCPTNPNSVTIAAGVTAIPIEAFQGCSNLNDISFVTPNTLTSIGDGAFAGSGLTSFVMPNTVTSLGIEIFFDVQVWHLSRFLLVLLHFYKICSINAQA